MPAELTLHLRSQTLAVDAAGRLAWQIQERPRLVDPSAAGHHRLRRVGPPLVPQRRGAAGAHAAAHGGHLMRGQSAGRAHYPRAIGHHGLLRRAPRAAAPRRPGAQRSYPRRATAQRPAAAGGRLRRRLRCPTTARHTACGRGSTPPSPSTPCAT